MSVKGDWRSSKKVSPANAQRAFQGEIFDVYQWDQELYDGSHAVFEKLVRPDTVAVIAVTKDKKILLTNQEQPSMKPFVDLPGGKVDMGLPALKTVQVELLEETGYRSTEWKEWFVEDVTVKLDWKFWAYIAYDCEKVQEPELEGGEKIDVREVDFDEFIAVVRENRLRSKMISSKIYERYFTENSLEWLRKLLRIE